MDYSVNRERELDIIARDEIEVLAILLRYPHFIDKVGLKKEHFRNEYTESSNIESDNMRVFELLQKHQDGNFYGELAEINDLFLYDYIAKLTLHDAPSDETVAYRYLCAHCQSMIQEYKKKEIQKALSEYTPTSMNDKFPKLLNRLEEINGINIGIGREDAVLTIDRMKNIRKEQYEVLKISSYKTMTDDMKLRSNDLVVVAAPTGGGKSSFMINILLSLLDNRYNLIYFNLEMTDDLFLDRALAIDSGVHIDSIVHKNMLKGEELRIDKSIECISKAEIKLLSGSSTLEQLLSNIELLTEPEKQNIVFIDHLGYIALKDKMINNIADKYSMIMQTLRSYCIDHNVMMFVACQYNREGSKKKQDAGLYDLKGSSEIEQSATHVLLLAPGKEQEDNPAGETELTIKLSKNRNGKSNVNYRCKFYKKNQRIEMED